VWAPASVFQGPGKKIDIAPSGIREGFDEIIRARFLIYFHI
jgi:hypothetical protein